MDTKKIARAALAVGFAWGVFAFENANEAFKAAQALNGEKKYDEACAAYDEAIGFASSERQRCDFICKKADVLVRAERRAEALAFLLEKAPAEALSGQISLHEKALQTARGDKKLAKAVTDELQTLVKLHGEALKQAKDIAEKQRAYLSLASRHAELGEEEKTLALYGELFALPDGTPQSQFAALSAESEYLRKHKQQEKALEKALAAMELAKANPDVIRLRDAGNCLGSAYYDLKKWDEAIEAFIFAAENYTGGQPQVASQVWEAILWVTRSGRHAEADAYCDRIRAIKNAHINVITKSYEISARTLNAQKRFADTLALYDRVLADTNILAKADVAGVVNTAAQLVRGLKSGNEATFDFYDKVIADPAKYHLDDKGYRAVIEGYAGRAWRSMDKRRIEHAVDLAAKTGKPFTSDSMACSLLRYYNEMETFPKDEKDIRIPTDLSDFGIDPNRKVVHAKDFGWNPTNATECLQRAFDSDASTVIIDDMGSPWYIWSVDISREKGSNKKIVFKKGVVVLSAPETKDKDAPGWYRRDMFHLSSPTNLFIVGEGDFRNHDVFIGKYRSRKERFEAAFEYGGNGFGGSCRNVVIKNLYVAHCGQDALCWGGRNSFVVDCLFDDNYRQGMSLGGGENCVYKNVTFCNTFGGEPHCGVDFEPYYEIYSTPHHYFFDCKFFNNASKNVIFATSTYAPMTAYFKRCEFEAQRNGNIAIFARAGIYMEALCHAPSKIIFDDCRIDGYSDGWGNPIQFLSTFLYDVTFKNCVINDKGCLLRDGKEIASPIHLILDRSVYDGFYPNAGVVTFDNVKINGYDNVPLVQVTDKNGKYGVNTFRGEIDWNGKKIDMSTFSYLPPDRDLVDVAEADPVALTQTIGDAHRPASVPWEPSFDLPFGHAYYNPLPQYTLLCRGEKGKTAEFVVRYHCNIRAEKPVAVTGPDGRKAEIFWPKTGDNTIAYTFPADGVYSFDFNVPSKLEDDELAREGFSVLSVKGTHPTWQAGLTRLGRVVGLQTGDNYPPYVGYFEVPADEACWIKLLSGGLEICDHEGNVVHHIESDDYSGTKCLSFASEEDAIWSFRMLSPSVSFKFFAPLPGIWADDPQQLPTVTDEGLPFKRVKKEEASVAEIPSAKLFALPIRGAVAKATDKAAAERAEFGKGDEWAQKYRQQRYHYDWSEPAAQTQAQLKVAALELEALEPVRKMRDMEKSAARESDDLRRYVAFVSLYAPVLALEDEEAKAYAAAPGHLEDEDLLLQVNEVIGKFGAEMLEDGFYYADYTAVMKLAPFIVARLDELGLNK